MRLVSSCGIQSKTVSTHGDDIQPVGVDFGEPLSQTADQSINSLFANAVSFGFCPNGINDLVSAAYLAHWVVQQFEEPVLCGRQRRLYLLRADPDSAGQAIQTQPASGRGSTAALRRDNP